MRAAVIHRYGKNDQIQIEEIAKPQPLQNDLLVSVRAASVNPVDFKIRAGALKQIVPYRLPLVLGNDLSGVVVSVGASVSRFKVGDEVFARLDKDRIGAYAEFALIRETAAAHKPANLSHVEAASIPLVGLTAWQALIDIAKLSAGQSVLIHAGSGGVGTFAIQLAKHLGATVATTVGARNSDLVKALGADQIIDYKSQRFDELVKDVDVVFDTQGGETLERSFRVVKRGGIVVTVGGVPDAKFAKAWGLNPFLVLALGFLTRRITRAAARRGAKFEYLFMHADGAELGEIAKLLDAGVIGPVIDRTFPLASIRDALAYAEAGRTVGKVVVTIP
jgi:NADPH:quinone reductase-like Zn-dependent oxidoreductase